MARPTIHQIKGLGDFQPQYTWDMAFIEFPPGLPSPPSMEDLNLRCVSSGVPKKSDQDIPINIRGHQTHQPGIVAYEGTITLTFTETVDQLISNFIYDWQGILWDPVTGAALPTDQIEATLQLTRLDRENNPTRIYTLYYCKPEDRDHGGELGGDTNDVYKPTITLRYGYFEEASA